MSHPPLASPTWYGQNQQEQFEALEGRWAATNITICVVDSMHGRPAEGLAFRLQRKVGGEWQDQMQGHTDERGEVVGMLSPLAVTSGIYRVELDIDGYFASLGMVAFNPNVTMDFRVLDPTQQHHISILITPHSYLTYRSS